MSSVLHPVGPEPARTYWLRRVVILGIGLILLVAVVAMIMNSSGASAVSADSPPMAPTVQAAPPVSATSTSSAAMSSPSSGSSPSPRASTNASIGRLQTSSTPTTKPTKSGSSACEGSKLRTTLTGKRNLKLKQPATFALSLINGGKGACAVSVNSKNFELKINSGGDRIWSTNDCSTAVTPITTRLESEQAVEWKMTWDGLRSTAGCKHGTESLGEGTYIATAELSGAKPVQLRMTLSD